MDCKEKYKNTMNEFTEEFENLYKFCVKKRFTREQLKTCLSPFTKRKVKNKRSWLHYVIVLSSLIAMLALLMQFSLIQKFFTVALRLILIEALAVWDWSGFFNNACIVTNPYVKDGGFRTDACEVCESFSKSIDRLQTPDAAHVITDNYLRLNRPFVITDALRGWPSETTLDLDSIVKLYTEEPALKTGLSHCEFYSTEGEQKSVHDFIRDANDEKLPESYQVSWENCETNASKVFRLLTKRPQFVPAMAEISKANQLIIAKGNFNDVPFRIPQQNDCASWLTMVEGSVRINIFPYEQCKQFGCDNLSFLIKKGEAVIVPTDIWHVNYTPVTEGQTIAFASTMIWERNY